jgi:DNA-directed RNA polymerase subunit RPC12/RpoP
MVDLEKLKHYICPICGEYGSSETKFPVCDVCGCENVIIITDKIEKECDEEIKNFSKEKYQEYLDSNEGYEGYPENDEIGRGDTMRYVYRECLRRKIVYNNPQFSKTAYNKMIKEQHKFDEEYDKRMNVIHCPYCGSTQIQMVPRKWSPFAGILTNKVDRVCMNCKKTF